MVSGPDVCGCGLVEGNTIALYINYKVLLIFFISMQSINEIDNSWLFIK